MNKQKLIEQYNHKIKNCEILLKSYKDLRIKLRHEGDKDAAEISELSKHRAIQSAQRQCYIQFVSDLEYELEYAECHLYINPEESCQALKDRRIELRR